MEKQKDPNELETGVFIRGRCISSNASAFERKDKTGTSVSVSYELSLKPGVAIYQQYYDPQKESEVKVEGGVVTRFPKLEDLAMYEFKANRYRVNNNGQIVVTNGEIRRV